MKDSTYDIARQLFEQGVSVCPARVDGSKRPKGRWKQFQQERCSTSDLRRWFDRADPWAIAVVCGTVSNNLLVIDLDDPDLIEPFESKLREEQSELFKSLVAVETGSGKRHFYLFCDEPFGPRQTFVKMSDKKWAVEFRAEGNYVIGPGSPASTHASGMPYHVIRGDIGEIYSFAPDEVAALIELAKSFEHPAGPSAAEEFGGDSNGTDRLIDLSRPGDDFADHTDWAEILTKMINPPYKLVREDSDGVRYWKRPGGESEWSCKTGLVSANGRDLMRVFSTGCEHFEADQSYSKFAAYAAVAHDGDQHAAAAELRELGYGNQDEINLHDGLSVESTPLSMIRFRPVHWLWDQRLPLGYITNLTGDPGAGKGHLMASMITHVTNGKDWPDGASCDSGDVLVISDEDGYDDVIGPRCERHGADLDRVHSFCIRSSDGLSVHLDIGKHFQLLRELLEEHANTKLIFFDPLSAYLGGIDSNSNSDVRGVLHSLGTLAKQHSVVVIGIGHFGKGEKRAVTRTLGSIAFTAKARVEWQAGVHPDDEDLPDGQKRRLFLPAKNNLGSSPGLSYRISGPRDASVLTWDDKPVYESASLLGRRAREKKIDRAIQLIEDMLDTNDGRVLISDVRKAAKKIDISEETLRRAKRVVTPKTRKIDGDYYWFRGGVTGTKT